MATMMPIEKMKSRQNGTPIALPMAKKPKPTATASTAIIRLRCANSRRSGDMPVLPVCVRCAIRPNSVCAAGREHDGLAFSGHERCPGQQDVAAAQQLGLFAGLRVTHLGQRLAGDRGVVDPHIEGFDQSAVGRNIVARAEQNDVSDHHVFDRQLSDRIVSQHFHLLRQQILQGRQGALVSILLPE